jgi:hypothetical protein
VTTSWTCSVCGESHEGFAFSWGFREPDYWQERFVEQSSNEYFLNEDICWMIDDAGDPARFVRGLIEIPIVDGADGEESFVIGAWASLSEHNFHWLMANWDADAEQQGDPWFGWLSNSVPVYPETLNLKTNVVLQGRQLRPSIWVQRSGHPLALDQHEGITVERARELSERWLHLLDA